ncbi:MAG: hypothetical protein ACI4KG_01035 [Oscillospiraceae bacterium]
MKNKISYSERRNSEIKKNCIIGGIVLIILGIAFGIIAFLTFAENVATACIIMFLALSAIVIGVIWFGMPEKVKQQEADANDVESKEFAKILKRRDRMQKKQREFALKANHKLYTELLGTKFTAVFLIFFIGALIALYLWIEFENIALSGIVVFIMAVLTLIIFFDSPYKKLKKCAEEKYLDFKEVENDYSCGEVYRHENELIGIGNSYTIFVCNEIKQIICNNTIVAAEPFYEVIDMYNNGLYTGSMRKCYVTVYTSFGEFFRIKCAEFAEELIIEAYVKRKMYLHKDFELINRENYPVYFNK